MSKYYKAEDVIRAIAEHLCWITQTEYGDKFTTEDWLEEAEDYVSDLPAIVIGEDCISRADLLKTIDDNVSQQYNTYETYGLGLWALFVRLVENAPSVVPTAYNLSAVEDCISLINKYAGREFETDICNECMHKLIDFVKRRGSDND